MNNLLSGLIVGVLLGGGVGFAIGASHDTSNEKQQRLADLKAGFLQGCSVNAIVPEQVKQCAQMAVSGSK
ncbi:hypothetical protein [Burkholderia vietnamiensis]|jgi:hypothetical protein|uniref:hypothetical protein n=1 Tax=Burkholderia cepacia complex TaxID=87882 RepID=UPI00158EF11F|nr:hypothetical protein [Burkholderia vietnamiensis]UEC05507.1 hypothetical protein LK462_35455 [Burkholderia vietnamiensis]